MKGVNHGGVFHCRARRIYRSSLQISDRTDPVESTTFSSFALETGGLIEDGRMKFAVLYAVLSVAAGLIAVSAGQEIVRKI